MTEVGAALYTISCDRLQLLCPTVTQVLAEKFKYFETVLVLRHMLCVVYPIRHFEAHIFLQYGINYR